MGLASPVITICIAHCCILLTDKADVSQMMDDHVLHVVGSDIYMITKTGYGAFVCFILNVFLLLLLLLTVND